MRNGHGNNTIFSARADFARDLLEQILLEICSCSWLSARARLVLELEMNLIARARARDTSLEVLASNARCSQTSTPE